MNFLPGLMPKILGKLLKSSWSFGRRMLVRSWGHCLGSDSFLVILLLLWSWWLFLPFYGGAFGWFFMPTYWVIFCQGFLVGQQCSQYIHKFQAFLHCALGSFLVASFLWVAFVLIDLLYIFLMYIYNIMNIYIMFTLPFQSFLHFVKVLGPGPSWWFVLLLQFCDLALCSFIRSFHFV